MMCIRNINKILLYSRSNVIKSYVTASKCQFNGLTSKLMKSHSELAIEGRAFRFMSSINTNSTNPKPKHFTDDSNPDEVSIYQGKFSKQILRVKLFSLTTSIMGLLAQPILWYRGVEVGGTGIGVLVCSVAGVFTFITPLLLHFVTKKYVIDVRYNEKTDEYTCVTSSFFLFRNEIKFKVEDIHLPEIETMFTSMKIGPNKIPVFIDAASFSDTHHYARFMGYDKPLDIRISTNESEIDSSAKSTQIPEK